MYNIIGHSNIRKNLSDIVKNDKVAHAYIFEGIDGIGKRLVAEEFARMIMCEDFNETFCGKCRVCNTFNSYIDFSILGDSSENSIKVDEVRDISSELLLKPTISKRKVVIIDNAQNMNESAQNALLKILEEPPKYAVLILITNSKNKLLNTIVSRCINIKFNRLTNEEMQVYASEKNVSSEAIEYASGSIGELVKISGQNYIDKTIDIINVLNGGDLLEANRIISQIKEDKEQRNNIINILDYMIFWYYKNLKENKNKYLKNIEILEETRKNMLRSANTDISLDAMMIRIWNNK